MVPLVLTSNIAIGLAGEGERRQARAAWLADAGVDPVPVPLDGLFDLHKIRVLFIAGAPRAAAMRLAAAARAAGVLVHVEDVVALCDFHVPALVRRGELLLTVSTGGRSPALARAIREWLERRFGPEWSARVDRLGAHRRRWQREGSAFSAIAARTRSHIANGRWL